MSEDNKILLDKLCDNIYEIIKSRDTEAYMDLLSIITLTIEAIAEQCKDMSAVYLANRICEVIKHDEQSGGDES